MFAFVSNEYQGIVHSRQHLEILKQVYSYPVSQLCNTEEECWDFIQRHPRRVYDNEYTKKAGWKHSTAYVRIEYYVDTETVYANIYTDHFGHIQLNIKDPNVLQSPTYDTIKLKIKNVNVRDDSITSHCIAIQYIVQLMSPIVNIQLVIPDVSIFLALTAYTGKNAAIKRVGNFLNSRIGKVALILK